MAGSHQHKGLWDNEERAGEMVLEQWRGAV